MSQHEQIEAEAAAWIACRDSSRWSADRQTEFDRWMAQSTAHRVAYLRLNAAWSVPVPDYVEDSPEARAEPARDPLPSLYRRTATWRMAASLMLAAGASLIFSMRDFAPGDAFETPVGGSKVVALSDGSQLVLNTDTTVRSRVNAKERVVWLDRGEAFFDIAHDPSHPFVVVAGDSRLTVLGTKFVVRTQEGRTVVDVVEGKVRVEPRKTASKAAVVLTSNQRVLAVPGKLIRSTQSEDQLESTLGWREGKLIFNQVSLEYAAAEFNRYNTTKLVVVGSDAQNVIIGGRFDVNNVHGFARLLKQGFGLEVAETPGQIVVSAGDAATP